MSPLDYRRGAAPDSHPEEVRTFDSAGARLSLNGDSAAASRRSAKRRKGRDGRERESGFAGCADGSDCARVAHRRKAA